MRVKILKNVKNTEMQFHILRMAISWHDHGRDPINKDAVDKVGAKPIYHRWIYLQEIRKELDTGREYFDDMIIDDNEISEIAEIAGVI